MVVMTVLLFTFFTLNCVFGVSAKPGLDNGGFGDRLAGLLSAVAMSIRFNRTLLIKTDNDLHNLFRPYHPKDIISSTPKYNWENFNWSSYNTNLDFNNMTVHDLTNCINTVSSQCTMSLGDVAEQQVVFHSNRAFLCKWDNEVNTSARTNMKNILGISEHSNLFEVAGCMLRLALWPTDFLFNEVGRVYEEFEDNKARMSPKLISSPKTGSHMHSPHSPFFQIGLHFRCGDVSFQHKEGNSCLDTSENRKNGEGMSMGSPLQIADCAVNVLRSHIQSHHLPNNSVEPLIYVTSDNMGAAHQINASVNFKNTLISPQGCHVNMGNGHDCHQNTLTYWLLLSFSKVLVTQTLGTDHSFGPSSSFSKYAGIYGLNDDVFRDARHCNEILTNTILSRIDNSNWKC